MPASKPANATDFRGAEELRLSAASFRELSALITRTLGIKMPDSKLPMLRSRLQRRLRALGFATLEAYVAFLLESPEGEGERQAFVDAVTTNKTDFFREARHFDYLSATGLPALDPGGGQPWQLRAWCAGCSSGEEPYTLAMVLRQFGEVRGSFDFGILATDISASMLARGREAIYPHERVEPVPTELRRRYLLRSRAGGKDLVRIVPALRARVQFHPLNFMDADYPVRDQFELIFFRNVAIYFDRPTQQRVVERLCRHLKPGGYLFVGHSESLLGLGLPLRMVASAVYQKPACIL
ncbi:MAG: CheR family methyltransferase [Opitutales bacterium]